MTKKILLLLGLLSIAAPACVVRTTNREVGSVSSDGSVYLGWHLLARDNRGGGDDQETYDIGAHLGPFSAIRLHADRPVTLTQVLVIFADGERWVAPAPQVLGQDEWTNPIFLPRAPRPIHSIVVFGRSTTSLLAHLEFYGSR
jgi:hypothetical protein